METHKVVFGKSNVSKEYQKPELVDLNEMRDAEARCQMGSGANPLASSCTDGSAATGCSTGTGPH